MNIRQVRKKIKTIGNVKKITKAMELVSAVKMRKAQQEEVEGRPYRDTLDSVITKISKLIDSKFSALLKNNKSNRELVILISSNKGLCGSFNFNLFRYSVKNIDFSKSDFIILGKKAGSLVGKMGGKIIADFSTNKPLNSVSAIFNLCLKKFLDSEYESVYLVYNRFISALRYEPVKEKLLPVKFEARPKKGEEKKVEEEYLIEPAPEKIIDSLLRDFVEEKIRGAVISNEAGEHSARMISMKNATENAGDLIYDMTLLRNKLRQQKITYELLDMITAKESVESV